MSATGERSTRLTPHRQTTPHGLSARVPRDSPEERNRRTLKHPSAPCGIRSRPSSKLVPDHSLGRTFQRFASPLESRDSNSKMAKSGTASDEHRKPNSAWKLALRRYNRRLDIPPNFFRHPLVARIYARTTQRPSSSPEQERLSPDHRPIQTPAHHCSICHTACTRTQALQNTRGMKTSFGDSFLTRSFRKFLQRSCQSIEIRIG